MSDIAIQNCRRTMTFGPLQRCCLLGAIALLSACASKPPASVAFDPPGSLSLAEVRAQPSTYQGSSVRWGGEIARVENKSDKTWIEVIERELYKDTKPIDDSRSQGRFIASINGFADPAVYQEGRLLTVVGKLEEPVNKPIGEFDYRFPVVNVSGSHLWKVIVESPPSPYPPAWWYYDPWPYYPRPHYHYH